MLPDEKELRPGKGKTLLEASLDSGVPHVHVCGPSGGQVSDFVGDGIMALFGSIGIANMEKTAVIGDPKTPTGGPAPRCCSRTRP